MNAEMRERIAQIARAAGAPHWWGDGERPWTGPKPVHVAEVRGDMYARKWAGEQVIRETGTVILEPTPAQLARGERVLFVATGEAYSAIATLHDVAVAHGWAAQIAQSRYLAAPMTGGDVDRRGRRLETVVQSLRVQRDPVRAYGIWEFDVERAKWTPQGAGVGVMMESGMAGVTTLNITGLEEIIKGKARTKK